MTAVVLALLVASLVVLVVRGDLQALVQVSTTVAVMLVVGRLTGVSGDARRSTLTTKELLVRKGPVRRTRVPWAQVRQVQGPDRWHDEGRAVVGPGRDVALPGLSADDVGRLAAALSRAREGTDG